MFRRSNVIVSNNDSKILAGQIVKIIVFLAHWKSGQFSSYSQYCSQRFEYVRINCWLWTGTPDYEDSLKRQLYESGDESLECFSKSREEAEPTSMVDHCSSTTLFVITLVKEVSLY